jgi:hypothetical protein
MSSMDRRRAIVGSLMAGVWPAVAHGAAADSASGSDRLLMQLGDDLKTHQQLGIKRSGGPGDRATAQWISQRLGAIGFRVETDAFDVPFFEPARADLVCGNETVPLFVQPVAVPTPSRGLTAHLVPVYSLFGARAARDGIALVVLPYGRHAAIFSQQIAPLLAAAVNEGARAIILVTTGPTDQVIGLNTRRTAVAPVPLALLAPAQLPRLLQAISRDDAATLTITGESGMRSSWNVIGTRQRGPRWLVISTPRSGWFTCVGERGTGTAVFLELCSWAAKRWPDLSVLALNTGGHEIDFSGLRKAIDSAPPPGQTKLWAHIGASLATREAHLLVGRSLGLLDVADTQRALMVTEGLEMAARGSFAGLAGLETPIKVIPGAGELGDIVARGYRNAFAVLGAHRWFHTSEDTLDKVQATLLRPVYEAHRRLIEHELG